MTLKALLYFKRCKCGASEYDYNNQKCRRNYQHGSSAQVSLKFADFAKNFALSLTGNSVRSNKSSVSFETASTSGSSTYNAWHTLYSNAVPLFLNFSCSIRFSNREMHTIPVDHLPSCVMELMHQCPDIAESSLTSKCFLEDDWKFDSLRRLTESFYNIHHKIKKFF